MVSMAVVPTQPVERASKMTVVSCLDKADPPTSSFTKIPPNPSSAHFLKVSLGKTPSSSHFPEKGQQKREEMWEPAKGANSLSAKSLARL
jgi:hypothetical protein